MRMYSMRRGTISPSHWRAISSVSAMGIGGTSGKDDEQYQIGAPGPVDAAGSNTSQAAHFVAGVRRSHRRINVRGWRSTHDQWASQQRHASSRRIVTTDPHPYSALTPDRVLDALDSVGIRGDGRMLPLGSYEN